MPATTSSAVVMAHIAGHAPATKAKLPVEDFMRLTLELGIVRRDVIGQLFSGHNLRGDIEHVRKGNSENHWRPAAASWVDAIVPAGSPQIVSPASPLSHLARHTQGF